MSEKTIENVREYNLDPKEVIKGLNGYYESDKRNGYITVRRNDVEGPAYFTAVLYLSALIEWLREDHDIFYRPGLIFDQVEAARNAAKMCCLRASIKAALSKRDLWYDKDADIPDLVDALLKAYDTAEHAERETRKAVNEQLKNTERETRKKDTDYTAEILRDILEALGISKSDSMHFDVFGLKTKALQRASVIKSEHDRYLEQLDKAAADYKALSEEHQKLKNSQKSDTNKLIRDCCVKHDIIAPSRYLSDEACVEYLFSLIERKDRPFLILQDLYRDIFKRQPDGLSNEDIATKILDKVLEIKGRLDHKEAEVVGEIRVKQYEKDLLKFIYKEYEGRIHLSDKIITYNPPSVRNTITKIISDYARSRTRVDILEGRIKSIFDKYKTDFTVDDYVINGDPTTSFMLDCIWSWIASPAESRGKTRAEIENYKLKLKDYILRDIEEHGYRYDGLETKSIEKIVDWIIAMATCDRSNIALRDIYTAIATPIERRRYNIDDCDGAIVDHMKDYILERFEGFNSNTEYCLKKMAELDGCQKDLKILEEQQKWLIQQNSELATKVSTKDDEISRLKGLINEINKEEDGEWFKP